MKILNCFNMVQNAYNVTKAMRKRGIEADLLIPEKDYLMSNPVWEDYSIESDNVGAREKKEFELPSWIKILKQQSPSVFVYIEQFLRLRSIVKEYDFVFAHASSPLYCQYYRTPWVPYDAGLIRYLPLSNNPLKPYDENIFTKYKYRLIARSYQKAKRIIFTNPDTYNLFYKAHLDDKLRFIPFPIPTTKYAPQSKEGIYNDYGLVLLNPSRNNWIEKGSDKIINAFHRFILTHPKSLLIMVDWGTDISKSKQLFHDLRIPQKNYQFIKPISKNKLIRLYNEVDVVLDQFTLGSWGTTTPEAMACEKPVIMYYDKTLVSRCFESEPPLLNSFTIGEIEKSMEFCTVEDFRKELGKKARLWVQKTHDPDVVVDLHLKLINELS